MRHDLKIVMELPKLQKRVLIVDDNRDAADIIADYLRLFGIQALAVYDGETAFHEACHFKPHVIFLDIGMPGKNGYEVALLMRQTAVLAETRLIALTAWDDPATKEKVRAVGFQDHIVKPVTLDYLLKALE